MMTAWDWVFKWYAHYYRFLKSRLVSQCSHVLILRQGYCHWLDRRECLQRTSCFGGAFCRENPALLTLFCFYHWYFQSHFYEGLFICHCYYLFDQVFGLLITTLQPSLASLEVQAATMYTTFFPQRSVAVCVRTAVCVGVGPNKCLALSHTKSVLQCIFCKPFTQKS